VILLIIIGILLPVMAWAQSVPVVVVPIGLDLTVIVSATITAIFSIVGSVLMVFINQKIKNHNMAMLLENALQNGLGVMQLVAQGELPKLSPITIPGVSAKYIPAIQYAMTHASEAIEHFKLDPVSLEQKLQAREGRLNIQTNIATAASTAQSPAPLDPIILPASIKS
jgi:hypothetical protein